MSLRGTPSRLVQRKLRVSVGRGVVPVVRSVLFGSFVHFCYSRGLMLCQGKQRLGSTKSVGIELA